MQTERTRSASQAVALAEVMAHLRLTESSEAATITAMIDAATFEIEERAGLAILTQTIRCTTDGTEGQDIALPVGPATGTATVETLGDDGTLTAVASGFWLETGRWPVLHITDATLTGRLRITYTAGAATATQDVRHAISDQVGLLYECRGEPAQGVALSMSAAAMIARRGKVRI